MLRRELNLLSNSRKQRQRKLELEKQEYNRIMKPILRNKKVREMKKYNHHSHTDCFKHSLHVSYYNYIICKKLGLNAKSGAKAGMLHDLFLYDWHEKEIKLGKELHGFTHPHTAVKNAEKDFKLTDREKDIIVNHMFPLTPVFPKYKETVVITLTDKFCSICEVMDRFFKKAA